MRTEILLDRPMDCADPHRNAVVNNMDSVATQKVRVYRTFSYSPSSDGSSELDFTFTTTHKDTHLSLGLLDRQTLRHLGHLLEQMFENGRLKEIVLLKDRERKEGWLIRRSQDGHEVDYNWSFGF